MRGLAWLLLLGLALAGCSDASDVPEGIPTSAKGDALPTLQGFVVDDAIRPLEGATVRFLGTDVQATTDADGHYEIFRPTTQAEAVLVTATSPGFIPRTQQVQVSGRLAARLDFGLEVNPYVVPHIDVLEFRATFGCIVQTETPAGSNRYSCDVPNPMGGANFTPDPLEWWINPTPGFAGLVVQVAWSPNSAIEERLHVVVRGPVAGGPHGTKGSIQAEAEGTSPLRLEVPEDAARGFGEWTAAVVEFTIPEGPAGAPVVLSRDQIVEAFATVFYVDPAPPGYLLG